MDEAGSSKSAKRYKDITDRINHISNASIGQGYVTKVILPSTSQDLHDKLKVFMGMKASNNTNISIDEVTALLDHGLNNKWINKKNYKEVYDYLFST